MGGVRWVPPCSFHSENRRLQVRAVPSRSREFAGLAVRLAVILLRPSLAVEAVSDSEQRTARLYIPS
jgi:hypothetical protein